MTAAITKKVALIMGVANQRSIALSCMESFLQKGDWDVILTVQNEKARTKVQKIIEQQTKYNKSSSNRMSGKILGVEICDVTDQISTETFFREYLQETLHNNDDDDDDDDSSSSNEHRNLQAVIHSLAFAPDLKNPLIETTREAYLEAHEISAYSLIQVARESLPYLQQHGNSTSTSTSTSTITSSLTTLSYLGAGRAIPGYNVMGPAKASLESIVRGLALELGQQHDHPIRVNAVRAGPIPTVSSKGGIAGFERMRQDVQVRAPLGNVTASQVAATVYHVAAEACGMTGQTIEVDGGYSIVAGPSHS
jgi:enoyl-[acyl-carrier protein] reductase I